MSNITSTEFIESFPVFAEEETETITKAIIKADALINGYLTGKVTIPATVPDIIKTIASDLTCYYLQQSNLQAVGEDSHNLMYKNAVALLKDIANGTIKIESATAEEEAGKTSDFMIISTAGGYDYRN